MEATTSTREFNGGVRFCKVIRYGSWEAAEFERIEIGRDRHFRMDEKSLRDRIAKHQREGDDATEYQHALHVLTSPKSDQ